MKRKSLELWTNDPRHRMSSSPQTVGPPAQRTAEWDCSLHHGGVEDSKFDAADMPPLWESHSHKSGAGTERSRVISPVSNARNQINAVIEAGLGAHIALFANVINLASHMRISVNQMDLVRIRKVVSFPHQSAAAAHVLNTKQELLQVPFHKLIHNVKTRWNSTWSVILSSRQLFTLHWQTTQEKYQKRFHLVWFWFEKLQRRSSGCSNSSKPLQSYWALKPRHLCLWSHLWKQGLCNPCPEERMKGPETETLRPT